MAALPKPLFSNYTNWIPDITLINALSEMFNVPHLLSDDALSDGATMRYVLTDGKEYFVGWELPDRIELQALIAGHLELLSGDGDHEVLQIRYSPDFPLTTSQVPLSSFASFHYS